MDVPSPPLKRLPVPPTKKVSDPPSIKPLPYPPSQIVKVAELPCSSTAIIIVQRAEEHEKLLKEYNERSDAPTQLKQTSEVISGLEKDLASLERKLRALEVKTHAERSDHAALRDSTLRKWAYTMLGRKNAYKKMVSREESDYVEALREECEEKSQVEMQQRLLNTTYDSRTRLQQACEEFRLVQKRLDSFYDSIFSGLRNEYPDEEATREQASVALSKVLDLQGRIQSEQHVLEYLEGAKKKMNQAVEQVGKLSTLALDLLSGGNTAPDRRRSAVDKARRPAGEARTLIHQARAIQPLIESMDEEDVLVPKGRYWADIASDESSHSFHHKVNKAKEDLGAIQKRVKTQVVSGRERLQTFKAGLEQAEADLENTRTELRDLRTKIFERTVADAGDWDAPPKYQPP